MTPTLWTIARVGFVAGLAVFGVTVLLYLIGIDVRVFGRTTFLVFFAPMWIALFILMLLFHFKK